jgi:hypothetical protein
LALNPEVSAAAEEEEELLEEEVEGCSMAVARRRMGGRERLAAIVFSGVYSLFVYV